MPSQAILPRISQFAFYNYLKATGATPVLRGGCAGSVEQCLMELLDQYYQSLTPLATTYGEMTVILRFLFLVCCHCESVSLPWPRLKYTLLSGISVTQGRSSAFTPVGSDFTCSINCAQFKWAYGGCVFVKTARGVERERTRGRDRKRSEIHT
jgi:hypothetical protein